MLDPDGHLNQKTTAGNAPQIQLGVRSTDSLFHAARITGSDAAGADSDYGVFV